MSRFFMSGFLALTVSVGALSSSTAQSVDPPGPVMGMMGGGCPMIGMMGRGMMRSGMGGQGTMSQGMMGRGPRMDAMAQGRLAYLKRELDITEAQTEAWNGYAEAVRTRVDLMQGMRQGMHDAMQKGTATERMDARIVAMEAMIDSMKALKPATEKLYSVLTDEQKKLADQLIGVDCGAI